MLSSRFGKSPGQFNGYWMVAVFSVLVLLSAAATSSAALASGLCPVISDEALAQAFGMRAAGAGRSNPDATGDNGPAIADQCTVFLTSNSTVDFRHVVGVSSDDMQTWFPQATAPAVPADATPIPDPTFTVTPIADLGDSATLRTGHAPTVPTMAWSLLTVRRGADGYVFWGYNLADPQTSLTAMAQMILDGSGS